MKHFYIVTNFPKDPDLLVTSQVMEYLTNHGAVCTVRPKNQDPEVDYRYSDPDKIPADTECVIVLGGDGTLMRAAGDIVERQIPILGINTGHLGFLAETDQTTMIPALDALLQDTYQIEHRMMLQGDVYNSGRLMRTKRALNDVVIGRKDGMHLISMDLLVNGAYLNTYRADGLIIATPTGSTGYSLSAGGPIIAPEAGLFLVTPLAPHTLNTRGIVLPPDSRITVRVNNGRDQTTEHAMAYFDGGDRQGMDTGDYVEIRRADQDVLIVKTRNDSFLDILRRKLQAI